MNDAQRIVASASHSSSSSPTRPAHGAYLRRVAGACVWAFAKVAELREGGEDCLLGTPPMRQSIDPNRMSNRCAIIAGLDPHGVTTNDHRAPDHEFGHVRTLASPARPPRTAISVRQFC